MVLPNWAGTFVDPGPADIIIGGDSQNPILKIGDPYTIQWKFNSSGHNMALYLSFTHDSNNHHNNMGNITFDNTPDFNAATRSLLNTQMSTSDAGGGNDAQFWPDYSYDWTVSTMNLSLPTDPSIFSFEIYADDNFLYSNSPYSHTVNMTRGVADTTSSSSSGQITVTASTAAPTSTSTTTSNNANASSSSLTTSGKVGLGVGLGIGIPLLLLVLGFLGWRLIKRRRRKSSRDPDPGFTGGKAELDADELAEEKQLALESSFEKRSISELPPGKETISELPQGNGQGPQELWAGNVAEEMDGEGGALNGAGHTVDHSRVKA